VTRDMRLVTDQPPPGYAMMNLSCANAKSSCQLSQFL
jgi:hypothetical protein